jgi:hypothetical protein
MDKEAAGLLKEAEAAGRTALEARKRVDAAIAARAHGTGPGPTAEELAEAVRATDAAHACWNRYRDYLSQTVRALLATKSNR